MLISIITVSFTVGLFSLGLRWRGRAGRPAPAHPTPLDDGRPSSPGRLAGARLARRAAIDRRPHRGGPVTRQRRARSTSASRTGETSSRTAIAIASTAAASSSSTCA